MLCNFVPTSRSSPSFLALAGHPSPFSGTENMAAVAPSARNPQQCGVRVSDVAPAGIEPTSTA